MLKKGFDTLAIFSIYLSILSNFIALFVAINLPKKTNKDDKKQKQSDKKIKDELHELENEINLLKHEIQKHNIEKVG